MSEEIKDYHKGEDPIYDAEIEALEKSSQEAHIKENEEIIKKKKELFVHNFERRYEELVALEGGELENKIEEIGKEPNEDVEKY